MKYILVLVSMFFSATSFAGLENVSWEQIQKNRGRYFVDAPGALFQNSNPRALGTIYKRFITVDGFAAVCVDGDKIYGGRVQSCVKKIPVGADNETCVRSEPNDLWVPISGFRTICADTRSDDRGTCEKFKTIPYKISTNVTAKIFDESRMRDGDTSSNHGLLGTKQMQLPNCRRTGM
jgi:hypothetical protein